MPNQHQNISHHLQPPIPRRNKTPNLRLFHKSTEAGDDIAQLEYPGGHGLQWTPRGRSTKTAASERHRPVSDAYRVPAPVSCRVDSGTLLQNGESRSHLVSKLIFLDQLCEISPYLPRSSIEPYVPYSILRSIYSQYYANSPATALSFLSVSPHHSPAVHLAHASPVIRQPLGGSTPQSSVNDSGYFKALSTHGQHQPYDTDSGSIRSSDNKHRNVRRSGPLDYGSSRKVKLVEGSTSGSTGPSPVPRFAVSRSGPVSCK